MNAYIGHFAQDSRDVAIITATSQQNAVDWCDSVGRPDSASFDGIIDPMVLRFRAKACSEPSELEEDETSEWVELVPHETEAIVRAGIDIERLMKRITNNISTAGNGDDIMRAYGPHCEVCKSRHFEAQPCKVVVESNVGARTHILTVNDDPTDVAVVIAPTTDIKAIVALAQAAGSNPQFILEIYAPVLMNIQLSEDGQAKSVESYAFWTEDFDMLNVMIPFLQT